MTQGITYFVGQLDQEFPTGTSIGNALRRLIERRYRNNRAKAIETQWDLDPKTAKNVVERGCVSERTLTKAAKAEGWALWMALGEELFDQSYDQFLESVLDEHDRIRERLAARKDHIRSLEARSAGLLDALDRVPPDRRL